MLGSTDNLSIIGSEATDLPRCFDKNPFPGLMIASLKTTPLYWPDIAE